MVTSIFSIAFATIFGTEILSKILDFHPALNDAPSAVNSTIPDESFTVVTFNLWRLCDPPRVPLIVDALRKTEQAFVNDNANESLPDILLFQEIECDSSTVALRDALAQTHWFDYRICGTWNDGAEQSGVAIAVNRAKFEVTQTNDIDLGLLWGDHQRCGLHATLYAHADGRALEVVGIHHSPHPLNHEQTDILVDRLFDLALDKAESVLIGGDFNFSPSSQNYAKVSAYFTDPFPAKRGKTHWLGGRIDLIFINEGLKLERPLNRTVAHEALRPTKLFRPYYRCADDQWENCALSDHMPEGGLFSFASADSDTGD